MARGIRTIYTRGLNKRTGFIFHRISAEEGRRLQLPKRRAYSNNDGDNSQNDINSVNTSLLTMGLNFSIGAVDMKIPNMGI